MEIMNTVEKRNYIHNHLYRFMDKELDTVFNKLKSLVEKDITLTEIQNQEIERRVMKHKSGESKSNSWNEVKERAKSQ